MKKCGENATNKKLAIKCNIFLKIQQLTVINHCKSHVSVYSNLPVLLAASCVESPPVVLIEKDSD